MALTPVVPTLSSPTADGFVITVNADGNPSPPATYYTFKILTGAGVFFVNSLGVLQDAKAYLPVSTITVVTAEPNTFTTVVLTASDNAVGLNESTDGPPAIVTTLAANPISQPYNNVYSTTFMALWLANDNPVGTQYEVQISEDPSFVTGMISSGIITTVGYVFNELLPTTTYYGRVRAINSVGDSTSFQTLGPVVTGTGPDTVKVIRVFNLLAERGYAVTWQPNQELNIASYNVYRSESPTDFTNFQIIGTVPSPVRSYFDRVPFTFGIVFYYIVTAVDSGGNESSLILTTPAQENSYHSFEEQPFWNTVVTSDLVTNEPPQGVVDGTNLLFVTLSPYRKGTVEVFLNGVKMIPGIDYNEGPQSQQITFLDPPDAGGTLRLNYIKFGT